MQREALQPLALALLCVVAIGLAAATLTNPVETGPDDPAPGSNASVERSEWNPIRFNTTGNSSLTGESPLSGLGCNSILTDSRFQVALVALLVLLFGYLYWRYGKFATVSAAVAVLPLGTIAYLFVTTCSEPWNQEVQPPTFPQGNATRMLEGAGQAAGAGSGGSGTPMLGGALVLLLLAGMVVLLLAVVFLRSTGDEVPEEPEPEPASDPSLDAIGRVAGEAADRIEAQAAVENEVFRAWREMTDHLAVEGRETLTPAEFRSAATDAGMDERHVSELTDLFREVRYGGRPADDEREARAVDALRAIEAEYADDEAADADEPTASGGTAGTDGAADDDRGDRR